MKILAFLLFALLATPSFADEAEHYDYDVIFTLEYKTHHICKLSSAPEIVVIEVCKFRSILRKELNALGYKLDLDERVWIKK